VIDAMPDACIRLPGPSWIPLWAAISIGGFFVLGTYHLWMLALVSLIVGTGIIIYWLWTGTAIIPEKPAKDVGLGLTLPLYMSGRSSPSWWAMFITMLALLTAFISLEDRHHRDVDPGVDRAQSRLGEGRRTLDRLGVSDVGRADERLAPRGFDLGRACLQRLDVPRNQRHSGAARAARPRDRPPHST